MHSTRNRLKQLLTFLDCGLVFAVLLYSYSTRSGSSHPFSIFHQCTRISDRSLSRHDERLNSHTIIFVLLYDSRDL